MILYKDKKFISNSEYPDTDWVGDADFVIPDGSDLAEKIKQAYPYFEFVFDGENIVDIEETEPQPVPPEPPTNAELAAAIAQAEAMLDNTVAVPGEAEAAQERLNAILVKIGRYGAKGEEEESSDFFEKLSLWLFDNYGTAGYSEMLPITINLIFKGISEAISRALAPVVDAFNAFFA